MKCDRKHREINTNLDNGGGGDVQIRVTQQDKRMEDDGERLKF